LVSLAFWFRNSEFEPGWRWSENVKPIAGTDSCQAPHLGYMLSGRMRIQMDDGTEDEARETSSPSSRVTMPRSSGDETCVFVDFRGFESYAKEG
jgi:hypothetical protein